MTQTVDCPQFTKVPNGYARGKLVRGKLPRRGRFAFSCGDHLLAPRCNTPIRGRMRCEFLQTCGLTSCMECSHSAYTGVNFPSVEGPRECPGKDAGPWQLIENNPYPTRTLDKSAPWWPRNGLWRKLYASTDPALFRLAPPENVGCRPTFSAVAVSIRLRDALS